MTRPPRPWDRRPGRGQGPGHGAGPRRERGPFAPAVQAPPEEGFLVGRRSVLEALEAGASLERIMVADEPAAVAWFGREGAEAARAQGIPVVRVPRTALDRLAGGAVHQGVAARSTEARLLALEDVLATAPAPALLVLVDGIEDPRNLGALIRSAAAAGASGILLPERRTAPLGPACAKAAAGTLRVARLARVKNPARALEQLAEAGVWSVGLAAGAPALWDQDLKRPTCLVVGGEGKGLTRLVRERCDALAGLPLAPGIESLNASVAAGIALYEVLRQRRPG